MSFEVANLVFYSWLRSKQQIKKSELHDPLQDRMFILTGLYAVFENVFVDSKQIFNTAPKLLHFLNN
jgi:hypothetical protein